MRAMWRLAKQVGKRVVPLHWHPQPYLIRRIRKEGTIGVKSGPFRAMKYVDSSVGSVLLPKLLGVYEKELHFAVERACDLGFSSIINIGAGEGYYAVGMAIRNPDARVLAFESDAAGRAATGQLARLNAVDERVEIRGACEAADLAEALAAAGGKALVICDVEGAELSLLDPEVVGALRSCHILVELHDFVVRGLSDVVRTRFAASHQIRAIWQQDRTRADFPSRELYALLLPEHYLRTVMAEYRPERMSWFWMEPHA